MRCLYLILILTIVPTVVSAHNYYFGFAEMEYNSNTQKLETTLILSAHDLEDILIDQKKIDKSLSKLTKDLKTIELLEKELLNDFKVKIQQELVQFSCIGFEVKKNGLIHIYFESNSIQKPIDFLEITFSCMMNNFMEQQNKITYTQDSIKYTEVFLPAKPTAILKLS